MWHLLTDSLDTPSLTQAGRHFSALWMSPLRRRLFPFSLLFAFPLRKGLLAVGLRRPQEDPRAANLPHLLGT